MNQRDSDVTHEQLKPKKSYEAPTLTRYGTIEELTAGNTGTTESDATSKLAGT